MDLQIDNWRKTNLALESYIVLQLLFEGLNDEAIKVIGSSGNLILPELQTEGYIQVVIDINDNEEFVIRDKTKELFSITPKETINSKITEIIKHLNEVTNSRYSLKTESTITLLKARLKEYSVDEIKSVIDCKAKEWINTDMAKYLRPETLFNATKFQGYISEVNRGIKQYHTTAI